MNRPCDRWFWALLGAAVVLSVVALATPDWWSVAFATLSCASALGALIVVFVDVRRGSPPSPRPGG